MSRTGTPRCQTPELRENSRLQDNGARDNIKVSVRIRPLSDKESTRGDRTVWGADGSGGVGLLSAAGDRLDVKFAYDVVFSPSNTNEQVFDQVAWPAIEPVLQGISGTVFAYGVTSSGKTHTMMGSPSDAGVVPRAIRALFDRIDKADDCVYAVKLSMIEIYCEMLNDLLDSSKLNLDVQECQGGAGKGPVLVVKGLTEGKVASAEEALALIQQGQENRKVASTAFNDQSSRSHTICRLLVESTPKRSSTSALHTGSGLAADSSSSPSRGSGNIPGSGGSFSAAAGGGSISCTSAWLTLVDLAGSEGARAALSKDQQAEARDINRSLLTLGKVMYELAKGASAGHLPFRDSLLTRLLKPSLTGSGAKVAIICNVTPASSQSDETWNTLRFADGAKRIKITAVKNEALDIAAVVAQYQREVAALKAQLAALSGAAASAGGGNLSMDVLHAIQATLDNSSKDNAADELKDQAAQLQYLRECLSFTSQERDQLLVMNKKMTAMLVQQTAAAAAAAAAATVAAPAPPVADAGGSSDAGVAAGQVTAAAAAAPGGNPAAEGWGRGCAAGAAGVSRGQKRVARIRRCLSYESLEYYGQWQGSGADTLQQQEPLLQQQHCMDEPGLEYNAADVEQVNQLLRLTSDDLPESITHAVYFDQPAQQQQQPARSGPQEQQQQQLSPTAAAAAAAAAAAPAAAGEAAGLTRPAGSSGNISLKSGLGPRVGSAASAGSAPAGAAAFPPMLSKYYSAVSSFGGLSSTTDHSRANSSSGLLPSRPASGASAAAAAGQVVVPCPIVFPGSRRTSKTLAVAVPGAGGVACVSAAGWLGCVGLPVLPEGVSKSALCEVVEAHKALAAQEARLQLLIEHLSDKDALLEQARQLQQGEVLQLRLTITAADRALLRDKLAEAEQQIAGYQARQGECEQDMRDLLEHIKQMHEVGEQLAQERDDLAAQLVQLCGAIPRSPSGLAPTESALQLAAAAADADRAPSPAAITTRRSFSRCSSGCSSPEPGAASRIPLPPGSPVRKVATVGGSPSPPVSRIAASGRSLSRSVGSPPRKSAAAAASISSIKAAMAAAGGDACAAGALNSARSTGSPTPGQAAAVAAGAGSSMSPRLSKIASGLPALSVEGVVGTAAHLHSPTILRASGSPAASPRSLSRGGSFLGRSGPLGSDGAAVAAAAGALARAASFTGSPGGKDRERGGRVQASFGSSSSTDAHADASGFNLICVSSPFQEHAAAAADGRSASATASQQRGAGAEAAGRGSRRASGCGLVTGSSTLTSPRTQSLRGSAADGTRRGSSTGAVNVGALQSGKQSRIPLPPFLKRHSKRLLQLQDEDAGGDRAAAPALDRYLLGLHGGPGALPQVQEQQPSFVKAAGAAAAAAQPISGGILAAAAAGSIRHVGQQAQQPAGGHKVQIGASPFAAVAGAAADAVSRAQVAEGELGAEAEQLPTMTSVQSHPLELPDNAVGRSSDACAV